MIVIKIILLLIVFPVLLFSQDQNRFNTIVKADNGLYFMYYDSSNAKSTIAEFDDFLVLIEVPVKDEGADARILSEHLDEGKKVIESIRNYFPHKPIKYLLSSHWHPHSISSVYPFISEGITLVTTEKNFEKLKEFVDSNTVKLYGKNIYFVNDDSLVIENNGKKIIAYRIEQKNYRNIPTLDYLYFYLPDRNTFNCGCMYNKWEGKPVEGKEILSGREEDLNKFLISKNLKPDFIRLNMEKEANAQIIEYEKFSDVISNGIKASDLLNRYLSIDDTTLWQKRDSIVESLKQSNIPLSIINSCVYRMLRENNLIKALNYAKIQLAMNNKDANAWDTLGEVYFFLGEYKMAGMCESQSKFLDPDFGGGKKIWEEDLKNFKSVKSE